MCKIKKQNAQPRFFISLYFIKDNSSLNNRTSISDKSISKGSAHIALFGLKKVTLSNIYLMQRNTYLLDRPQTQE